MDTFTIKNKDIKVESIMEEIKSSVNKRKKEGIYSDKEIQNISQMEIDISVESNFAETYSSSRSIADQNPDALENHREYINQNWDIKVAAPIKSHRRFIGPLIIFLKKLISLLLRPVTNTILESQARFNSELVRLLNILTHKTRELETKYQYLKRETELSLDALGDGQRYLDNFCKDLDSKYADLEDNLTDSYKKRDEG